MKQKQYRNLEDRVANVKAMKRGSNIDLFMPISTADLMDVSSLPAVVYVRVAGKEQCMRDVDDCKAVMNEKKIVGTCVPYRSAGNAITRQPMTVMSFVDAKDSIDDPEVA
jgi:hypothetical protein